MTLTLKTRHIDFLKSLIMFTLTKTARILIVSLRSAMTTRTKMRTIAMIVDAVAMMEALALMRIDMIEEGCLMAQTLMKKKLSGAIIANMEPSLTSSSHCWTVYAKVTQDPKCTVG